MPHEKKKGILSEDFPKANHNVQGRWAVFLFISGYQSNLFS